MMAKDNTAGYKDGIKPLCKVCQAAAKKAYVERTKNINSRKRDPNEALPDRINRMKGFFKPPVWSVRPGAADHLQVKSRGL